MDVVLYSIGCSKCNILKKKLDAKNIKYTLIDNEQLMIDKGFLEAPILEVDGKLMDFIEGNKWANQF